MDLGKKLYELRKNKHYSQEQVAEKLGVQMEILSVRTYYYLKCKILYT